LELVLKIQKIKLDSLNTAPKHNANINNQINQCQLSSSFNVAVAPLQTASLQTPLDQKVVASLFQRLLLY
jgi:hypothetical protein